MAVLRVEKPIPQSIGTNNHHLFRTYPTHLPQQQQRSLEIAAAVAQSVHCGKYCYPHAFHTPPTPTKQDKQTHLLPLLSHSEIQVLWATLMSSLRLALKQSLAETGPHRSKQPKEPRRRNKQNESRKRERFDRNRKRRTEMKSRRNLGVPGRRIRSLSTTTVLTESDTEEERRARESSSSSEVGSDENSDDERSSSSSEESEGEDRSLTSDSDSSSSSSSSSEGGGVEMDGVFDSEVSTDDNENNNMSLNQWSAAKNDAVSDEDSFSSRDGARKQKKNGRKNHKPGLESGNSTKLSSSSSTSSESSSSSSSKAQTVPPPSMEVVSWMKGISTQRARRKIASGLRVKVRFYTKSNKRGKDGKATRKLKWYGGLITTVGKEGKRIRIKYDDGTSEIADFPDKDIVVDCTGNGKHRVPANAFVPDDSQPKSRSQSPSLKRGRSHSPPLSLRSRREEGESDETNVECRSYIDIPSSGRLGCRNDSMNRRPPYSDPLPESSGPSQTSDSKREKVRDSHEKPKRRKKRKSKLLYLCENDDSGSHRYDTITTDTSSSSGPSVPIQSERDPTTSFNNVGRGRSAEHGLHCEKEDSRKGSKSPRRDMTEEPPRKKKKKPSPSQTVLLASAENEHRVGPVHVEEESREQLPHAQSMFLPFSASTHESDEAALMLKKARVVSEDCDVKIPTSGGVCVGVVGGAGPEVFAVRGLKGKVAHSTSVEISIDSPKNSPLAPIVVGATEQEGWNGESRTVTMKSVTAESSFRDKENVTAMSPTRRRSTDPESVTGKAVDSGKNEHEDGYDDPKHISSEIPQEEQSGVDIMGSMSGGNDSEKSNKGGRSGGSKTPSSSSSRNGRLSSKKKGRLSGGGKREEDCWVRCDQCEKWRRLPSSVQMDKLPERWYCELNIYDLERNTCEADEETLQEYKKKRKKRRLGRMKKRDGASDEIIDSRESSMRDEAKEGFNNCEGDAFGRSTGGCASVDRKRNESKVNSISKKEKTMQLMEETQPEESDHSPSDDDNDASERNSPFLSTFPKHSKMSGDEGSYFGGSSDSGGSDVAMRSKSKSRNRNKSRSTKYSEKQKKSKRKKGKGKESNSQKWVQCEKCEKWRRLPPRISPKNLPEVWYCKMNTWDPKTASCDAPEDSLDSNVREYTILGSTVPSVSCIGSGNSSISGKLSYRNLIFGNGRKHRTISERTRVAESLFSVPHDSNSTSSVNGNCPHGPTVMYANSSSFSSKSSYNHKSMLMNSHDKRSLLELMGHSQLWEELYQGARAMQALSMHPVSSSDDIAQSSRNNNNRGSKDGSEKTLKSSVKEMVLHSLGRNLLAPSEVLLEIQCRDWDHPHPWAELRVNCTPEIILSSLEECVEEGLAEKTVSRKNGVGEESIVKYRCVRLDESADPSLQSHAPSAVSSLPNKSSMKDSKSSRCMKISKPWKAR